MPSQKPMIKLIRNEGYWRDRAEEALAISADTRNPECKRIMRELSATYEHLARLTAEFKSVAGTPASFEDALKE